MFKFAQKRQVRWPVTLKVPQDDGGVDEIRVTMQFELLARSEVRALESSTPDEIEATLLAKIKGWGGEICDSDGNPLEFTPDNLRAFLDAPYVERAVSMALLQASVGAPAKN